MDKSIYSNESLYKPGVCNIGKAEIDRRLTLGLTTALIATAWAFYAGLFGISLFLKMLVFFPAFAAAASLLQVYYHFCAYYGLLSVFNFTDKPGKTFNVLEEQAKKLDQKKALQILEYSAGIAIVFTILAVVLA